MALGLLGGLALALGGREAFKAIDQSRKSKAQNQQMSMLSSGDELLAQGNALGAIDQYRMAGLQKADIDQRMQAYQQQQTRQQLGPYESQQQYNQARQSLETAATKQLAPFQQVIQYYNETVGLKDGDVTKWTGTDDFIAMRNLLKQSLPNESVMGDDLANLRLASGGLPGWAQAMVSRLMGKGEQGVQARRDLLATMNEKANFSIGRRDQIRDYYSGIAQGQGIDAPIMLPPQVVSPMPEYMSQQAIEDQRQQNYAMPGQVRETKKSGIPYKIIDE